MPAKQSEDAAIGEAEFAQLMASFEPFQSNPTVAVACSGGADSLALTLLLHDWANKRDGKATALIVDHGLRKEAGKEAKTTADALSKLGIESEILRYEGSKPAGDVQAAARTIRYDLLSRWCVKAGALHLAVAHHRDDQAETALLRLGRGSGVDGLAAMSPVVETRDFRIVRPLLHVPSKRLRATVSARQITPIEDPSNHDRAFARVRVRSLSSVLAGEGMTSTRLADTATRLARARSALEEQTACLLARSAVIHTSGYGQFDPVPVRKVHPEIALRALSKIVTCIGGNDYPPRLARVERAYSWICDGMPGGGRTLSGCRLLPRRGKVLVCRESAAAKSRLPAKGEQFWDGRFRLHLGKRRFGEIRRLGNEGWRIAVTALPELRSLPIPPAVRASLPSVWRGEELRSVPHLGYLNGKWRSPVTHPHKAVFAPRRPLMPARFTLQ